MSDFFGYQGKRVIVSGCFSGMGEATARQLLALGAEVHGLDYKDCTLGLASFRRTDLRDQASIDAAVAGVGGKVDALFNCAGLPQTCPPLDVMKVNFIGTRYLTEKVIPLMGEGGAIASISSTGGLGWSRRIPTHMEFLQAATFDDAVKWSADHTDIVREGYAFSKEAVIVWTMLISSKLIKQGIRINCTAPGPTQTPMMKDFESATPMAVLDMAMQPINRRSTPEEQAGPLVFLNSAAATYVNGVLLPVDGGFMGGMATGQIEMAVLSRAAA
ncbi:MAG TPA: coniferyl-alcohol dehydrogenase [Acetobacteraceae bacterium]|nr:coniferyl-alcohol dehydrogenase [Acetobacteraceae bacterium]